MKLAVRRKKLYCIRDFWIQAEMKLKDSTMRQRLRPKEWLGRLRMKTGCI